MNRQTYLDKTIDEALATDADLWQVKFDGIWCKAHIHNGGANLYSRTEKLKDTFNCHGPEGILIGEYMYGSERSVGHEYQGDILVFDCVLFRNEDLRSKPYLERYHAASVLVSSLTGTDRFKMIKSYKIASAREAWNVLEDTEEGLIIRNSRATYDMPVMRCKYEVEKTVVAVDFHEGEGRHQGRLGAISVALGPYEPVLMKVGGGLSDKERDEIWTHMDHYRFRPLVVKGKGEFKSGALRHPNFVRWL